MKTIRIVPSLLAIAGVVICTAGIAADQPASVPLKPITKKLTFIYIPKLVHPWYEEVKRGVEYGIQEVKKEGIDVEYIWDAPAQADVDEENKKSKRPFLASRMVFAFRVWTRLRTPKCWMKPLRQA